MTEFAQNGVKILGNEMKRDHPSSDEDKLTKTLNSIELQ